MKSKTKHETTCATRTRLKSRGTFVKLAKGSRSVDFQLFCINKVVSLQDEKRPRHRRDVDLAGRFAGILPGMKLCRIYSWIVGKEDWEKTM